MDPLKAHAAWKTYRNHATKEFASSASKALLGLASTLTIGFCAGLAAGSENVQRLAPVFGVLTIGAVGYTVYNGLDAKGDLDLFLKVNSGTFRTQIFEFGLTSEQQIELAEIETRRQIHLYRETTGTRPQKPQVQELEQALELEGDRPSDPLHWRLAEELKSTIVVGQPGAGKGLLVSWALKHLKRRNPDLQVWIWDPKAEPSERGYWASADMYQGQRLSAFLDVDEDEYTERLLEFLGKFEQVQGPKLVVLDEAMALRERLGAKNWQRVVRGFNAICSMGRSSQMYGWILSQTPNTTDLGLTGGARNVYRRILLIDREDQGLLNNGTTFFEGRPGIQHFELSGRAAYDSLSGWSALERLSVPQQAASPVSRVQTPQQPAQASSELDKEVSERLTQFRNQVRKKAQQERKDLEQAIELEQWLVLNPRSRRKALQSSWLQSRKITGPKLDQLCSLYPPLRQML